MIKPYICIYPLPYITEEVLAPFISKLKKLEIRTNTSISYNYIEQRFDVEGEHQAGCKEVERTILLDLLPKLGEVIEKLKMEGGLSDIPYYVESVPTTPMDIVNVEGRPLRIDQPEIDDDEEDFIEAEKIENEQLIVKEFRISPIITNIEDLLIGPPQYNMILADYLELIPALTNTVCALKNRCLIITGETDCVDDAISRFNAIQNSYIAHLEVKNAICIHNPNPVNYYELCFCELNSYRHKSFVQRQTKRYHYKLDLHLMLPVLVNPITGEHEKPKDYIQLNVPRRYTIMEQRDHERLKLKTKELNDAFSLCNIKPPETSLYNPVSPKSTPIPIKVEYPSKNTQKNNRTETPTPKYTSSNNITYDIKSENVSPSESVSVSSSPPSVYEYEVIELPENNAENFPNLPSRPSSQNSSPILSGRRSRKNYSPIMSQEKVKMNRVMRIIPQKSVPTTINTLTPMVDRVKQYNYDTIKKSLVTGLNALRGFKGEIKLSAKIGKVFWTNVSPEVKNQIWKYQDINDITVKEHGVKPVFNDFTTIDKAMYDYLSDPSTNILTSSWYSKTSIYEFHCLARNQPLVPYEHVTIHMNEGIIDVRKVVLREKKTTAINWVSLDRKFDFQLYISTRVLTRCDVKPYTTFIKKVSICPITSLMTFEEVPRFVKIKYILLKTTKKYRIKYPFIVEVTEVEKLPIDMIPNTNKLKAMPGSGETWYTFEIRNVENDKCFEVNKDLEVGKEAPWTTDDILNLTEGDHNMADTITQFVTTLLLLIEKIEYAFNL